jgi:hypothetical protein
MFSASVKDSDMEATQGKRSHTRDKETIPQASDAFWQDAAGNEQSP